MSIEDAYSNGREDQVAFTVRFHDDDYHVGIGLSKNAVLKFDTIITNIGNAYDKTTGMFTAPLAGTYTFFLSQMSVNSHSVLYLAIVKHGVVLDLVYAEGVARALQVTTHMAAGEQVWVRQNSGDAVRGSWYTIFSGFLVQAD
nr:hypothetical protein BaRGS_022328 [Batillaria attramentaria]